MPSSIGIDERGEIMRMREPCLVYLQQTDYLKDLCKVSVWKSETTEQTDQYKIIALPTHPERVPINALERPTPQAARIILMWPLEIFA
ncbi:hypothetical protein P8452_32538 [Trifolium repens]|nr:hypothetical protein P8452_32538 [Trifolium repens]